MSHDNPPCASEICSTCPNPELVAARKSHFGRIVWHFECNQAVEFYAQDSGIVIKCAELDGPCCVENSRDIFVGSPDINPLKEFFETTMEYLGFK